MRVNARAGTVLCFGGLLCLACTGQGSVSTPDAVPHGSSDTDNPTDGGGSGNDAALSPPVLSAAALNSPEAVCSRASTILCEDFESDEREHWSDYGNNNFVVAADEGMAGSGLRQRYELGQVDAGYLGFFFGDHPRGADARAGERFDEVYLRWYHRFAPGWPASYPPKMARVRSHYVSCDWCFAWAEHFWITEGGVAHSDPVSQIPYPDGGSYVDSARWLGIEESALDFSRRDGEWVALEMRVRLNTPGQDDGRVTFWADDELVLDRSGLNVRGSYEGTGINVAMIDTYWNGGSPEDSLERWYDNVVVATERIGCARFSVSKEALAGQRAWSVEVARAGSTEPVWSSGEVEDASTRLEISDTTGTFAAGVPTCLTPGADYVVRARHARGSEWSAWSEWRPLF